MLLENLTIAVLVFFFNFYVTNDHKLSSLKQHKFILSYFCGSGIQHILAGSSAQGFTD